GVPLALERHELRVGGLEHHERAMAGAQVVEVAPAAVHRPVLEVGGRGRRGGRRCGPGGPGAAGRVAGGDGDGGAEHQERKGEKGTETPHDDLRARGGWLEDEPAVAWLSAGGAGT